MGIENRRAAAGDGKAGKQFGKLVIEVSKEQEAKL